MERQTFNFAQHSQEWFNARLGIPTASNLSAIVTSAGKPVKTEKRQTYMNKLLVERLTKRVSENYVSPSMIRGTELEIQARSWYTLRTGREVTQIGLATLKDDGWMCAASPDGLCNDRGLEIKIPLYHNLIGQLLQEEPPDDYIVQVQACMWVMEYEKWDLLLFSDIPEIPNKIIEIHADPEFKAAFEAFIPAFCYELDEAEKRLKEML